MDKLQKGPRVLSSARICNSPAFQLSNQKKRATDQSNPSDEGDGSDEETGLLDQCTVHDETKYEDGTDDGEKGHGYHFKRSWMTQRLLLLY